MPATRIVLENVHLAFETGERRLQVVDGVSFKIRDGDFLALIGPSGCGKTTIVNMMAGFLKPSSGSVHLDGRPIEGPGVERGVIFQEYGVFPWLTVRQNVEFGTKLRASRVRPADRDAIVSRYLDLMGLEEFADVWPRLLSGGMRQRLAIARAYAAKPDFLLMDEPFGALDAQTRSAMQNLLLEVLEVEKKTVVLVTHSVDEAIYLSSRIIVMTSRPTRIREIIEVPFAYPRQDGLQETPEFNEVRAHVRGLVMKEYFAQMQQAMPQRELRRDT